jgi:hypothetical protein
MGAPKDKIIHTHDNIDSQKCTSEEAIYLSIKTRVILRVTILITTMFAV